MLTSTAARVLLRRALPAATATSSSAASAAVGPVRCLNLHEYQSAKIMADSGVNVPFGASFLSIFPPGGVLSRGRPGEDPTAQ